MKRESAAPGPSAGYLYQIDRAMLHLSTDTNCDRVGIETLDDIEVQGPDGRRVEQVKHSLVAKGNPFSEGSKNLWRTLEIWTTAIDGARIDVASTSFVLVTNQQVPPDCFANKLSAADSPSALAECVKSLRAAAKELSGSSAESAKQVLDRKDEQLAELIKRLSLVDGNLGSPNDVRAMIGRGLHVPKGISVDFIVQGLYGWIKDVAFDCWRAGKPAWITREAFENQYSNLLSGLRQRKFRVRAESLVPVKENERESAREKTFVRQLKMVLDDSNASILILAIQHYLQAKTELTRLYLEGDITKDEMDEFEESLRGRWRMIFDKYVGLENPTDSDSKKRVGKKVYFETVGFCGTLAGVPTEHPYLTSGSYQKLADEIRVGWHPDHEELKRTR